MRYDSQIISTEYKTHNTEMQCIILKLKQIILNSGGCLEGNMFYKHKSMIIEPKFYPKQLNMFWTGKSIPSTKICEIGFNAGHSTMLLLLGKEKTPLDFTIFDIGHHAYTKPCLEYIKNTFTNVNFTYVEGDSTITIPNWISENPWVRGGYDIVHVDGGHNEHCIMNDMKNAHVLVKPNGFIVIDDTNFHKINKYVNGYIDYGNYKEIDIVKTEGRLHRIIQKCV